MGVLGLLPARPPYLKTVGALVFSGILLSYAILQPYYSWGGYRSFGGHCVVAPRAFIVFGKLFIVDDLFPYLEVKSSEQTHLSSSCLEAVLGTVSDTEKVLSKQLLNDCRSMHPWIGPWTRRSPCEDSRAGEVWGICPSPSRSLEEPVTAKAFLCQPLGSAQEVGSWA